MPSYSWLLSIFCLFSLAHSSFPALPPYLQTRTGTNFLQFGWSWKQNNLLLSTHFVLVGKVVNLFQRTFAPLLLSSIFLFSNVIITESDQVTHEYKWSCTLREITSGKLDLFISSGFKKRWPLYHQPCCFPGFSWKSVLNSPAFIWLVWECLLSWRHVLKRLKLQLCCPQKNRICFHSWGQNKWISLNDSIFSKIVGSRVVIKLSTAEINILFYLLIWFFFPGWELAQGIVSTWAQQNGQVVISLLQERDKSWKKLHSAVELLIFISSLWSNLLVLLVNVVFFLLTMFQVVHTFGNSSWSHGTRSLS